MVGLDVGSTTVKAVVIETGNGAIVWQDYQRHETKQPEKVLEFLERMESDVPIIAGNCRASGWHHGTRPESAQVR